MPMLLAFLVMSLFGEVVKIINPQIGLNEFSDTVIQRYDLNAEEVSCMRRLTTILNNQDGEGFVTWLQEPAVHLMIITKRAEPIVANILGALLAYPNCYDTYCEMLRRGIHAGIDINWRDRASNGLSLLHVVVSGGLYRLAQAILDVGGDVNVSTQCFGFSKEGMPVSDSTPLAYAVFNNDRAMARLLIQRGANYQPDFFCRSRSIVTHPGIYPRSKEGKEKYKDMGALFDDYTERDRKQRAPEFYLGYSIRYDSYNGKDDAIHEIQHIEPGRRYVYEYEILHGSDYKIVICISCWTGEVRDLALPIESFSRVLDTRRSRYNYRYKVDRFIPDPLEVPPEGPESIMYGGCQLRSGRYFFKSTDYFDLHPEGLISKGGTWWSFVMPTREEDLTIWCRAQANLVRK